MTPAGSTAPAAPPDDRLDAPRSVPDVALARARQPAARRRPGHAPSLGRRRPRPGLHDPRRPPPVRAQGPRAPRDGASTGHGPARRRPPARPLASLGATPGAAPARLPAQLRAPPTDGVDAVESVDDADREAYRHDGRRLVAALVAYLDADASTPPAARTPRPTPRRSSTTWPGGSPRRGTSLTESVALFVAARRPFLAELAGLGRRRTLDPARLGVLYEDASALLDRLLLRLIATHQEAAR